MPQADKSIAILTGTIVAALYVILLVGFTKESYLWRESSVPRIAPSRVSDPGCLAPAQDGSRQACSPDVALCATLFLDASERRSCLVTIDAVRRLVSEAPDPLRIDRLQRAMGREP